MFGESGDFPPSFLKLFDCVQSVLWTLVHCILGALQHCDVDIEALSCMGRSNTCKVSSLI